ncbi:prephenate dehydrogenase [Auritidibacter ignavus]|nr:prephenate dehydrogenase [Auritidibacter ignavus]
MSQPRFSRTQRVDTQALAEATEEVSQRHAIAEPVLIRGTGLLGTSIGLGLRAAGVEVLLSDPSPSALAVAADIGAGAVCDPAQAQPGTVVIAAPPDVTGQTVVDSLQHYPHAVVLDIASVKVAIADQVHQAVQTGVIAGQDATRYIGTHPMAGREKSGPVAARGQLFTAAPWVVCARPDTAATALAVAEDLARVLGATVYRLDPVDHDRAVALVSHMPQITASLLASRLQNIPSQALELAGNGLRDTVRIAGSDPRLWVQILAANSTEILPHLYGMKADLDRLISTLEDPTALGARLDVAQLIDEGNRGQARIPGKHGNPAQSFAVITVLVDDSPGQILAALQDVAEVGTNVEDLRMDHSAGYQVGMLEISVLPGQKDLLVQELTSRGWKVL